MGVKLIRRKVSVSDYHKMIEAGILTQADRVELIQGEIVQMSPIGSRHAYHVKRINALFLNLLGDQIVVGVQDPITIGMNSEPEPDISILRPPVEKYWSRHAGADDIFLVIEVADSSIDYDRDIKLPVYAEGGISEVWIINLNTREIEVHTQPAARGYKFRQIVSEGEALNLTAFGRSISVEQVLGPELSE